MLIKLLHPCHWGDPGDVRDFDLGIADILVKRGIAEAVVETQTVEHRKSETTVKKFTKVGKEPHVQPNARDSSH